MAGTSADTAIKFALAQVGKPYKWGATGPDAYDCSGLIQAAYAAAGVNLPRTTYTQITAGTPVKQSELLPGDLIFPDPGHVQIYLGNNQIVEAPSTGLRVRVTTIWGFWQARRVVSVPASGNYSGNSYTTISSSKPVSGLGGLFTDLTDSTFWMRLGIGTIGCLLIASGFVIMNQTPIGEAVKNGI